MDIITFYNGLSSLLLKYNVLIISENMNARIDKDNSPKRKGEYLAKFVLENKLACLDTKFQKRKEEL